MNLLTLTLCSVAGALVVRLVALRRLQLAARLSPSPHSIPRVALLSALGALATIFTLAAVSAGLTWLFLFVLTSTNVASAERIASAIETLRGLQEWAAAGSRPVALLVLAGLLSMLVVVAHRAGKRRIEGVFRQRFAEESRRLDEAFQRGEWEPLPNTPELDQLDHHIGGARQAIAAAPPDQDLSAAVGQLQRLYALRYALDRARRIDLQVDPDEIAAPPPRTRGQQVARFFVSEGLARSLVGGRRLAFLVTFLLLVPSLVTVQLASAAGGLDLQLVQLQDLQVAASAAEAREAWENAKERGAASPAAESAITDDEALDALSSQFELSYVEGASFSAPLVATGGLRVHAIRSAILENAAAAAPGRVTLQQIAPGNEVAGLHEVAASHLAEEHANPRGPRTAVGRAARERLAQLRVEQPGLWTQIKSSALPDRAAFQRVASIDDLGRFIVGEVAGVAMADAVDSTTPLGAVAEELRAKASPDALKRDYGIRIERYMTSLAGGDSLAQAGSVAAMHDPVRPTFQENPFGDLLAQVRTDDVATYLTDHPPSLQPANDVAGRRQAAATYEALYAQRVSHDLNDTAEFLLSFEDVFPSHATPQNTVHEELLNRVSSDRRAPELYVPDKSTMGDPPGPTPGVGGPIGNPPVSPPGGGGVLGADSHHRGRPNTVKPPPSTSSRAAFARARSFSGLRGFARIGGVLIGRTAETGATVELTGFSWTRDDAGITLRLTAPTGRVIERGPFHPSIVHQALTYATDARPVTVTMITAAPLLDLQILLHPALIDTPLGCLAARLDSFVDEASSPDLGSSRLHRERTKALELVSDYERLYRHAQWLRLGAISARLSPVIRHQLNQPPPDGVALERILSSTQQALLRNTSDRPLPYASAGRMADRLELPFRSKHEFYDSALINTILACSSEATLPGFDSCIERSSAAHQAQTLGWLYPPPSFQLWSGVRERAHDLDPELRFLAPPTLTGPNSTPFEFMLQLAFTSPPLFGKESEPGDPWEFPALKELIHTSAYAYASEGRGKEERRRTLLRMAEFTVLQRFFRAALEERFGPGFPLEGLARLSRETASSVKTSRTRRWLAKPGHAQLQLLQLLKAVAPSLERGTSSSETVIAAGARRCGAELSRALRAAGTLSEQAAAWPQSCEELANLRGPERTLSGAVTEAVNDTRVAIRLRTDLGIAQDESASDTCPEL